MARPTPTPPPAPEPDPLADLRGDDDLADLPALPGATDLPDDGTELEGVELRPMVSPDLRDEMVAGVIAAWHADPTSQGFLHGGGQCGCRYIARHALQACVPVAILDETEETVTLVSSDG